MKLTRFTNHSPASNSRLRSSQSGQVGTIRRCSGAARITRATARPCSSSRGSTGIELDVIGKTHSRDKQRRAKNRDGDFQLSRAGKNAMPRGDDQRGRYTAMPPPCGVGMRWEERASGFASAIRRSAAGSPMSGAPDNSAAGCGSGKRQQ